MQDFITIYLKQIDYFHNINVFVTDNKILYFYNLSKMVHFVFKNLLKKEDITKTKHQTN